MNKRIFKTVTAIAGVISMAAGGTSNCGAENNDTTPVISCDPPHGYVKAGRAGKAGKGQFYFCMKSGKQCKITIKIKDSGNSTNQSVIKTLNREGFATIPKSAKSWSTNGCGDIYKADLAKAGPVA